MNQCIGWIGYIDGRPLVGGNRQAPGIGIGEAILSCSNRL